MSRRLALLIGFRKPHGKSGPRIAGHDVRPSRLHAMGWNRPGAALQAELIPGRLYEFANPDESWRQELQSQFAATSTVLAALLSRLPNFTVPSRLR